MRIALYSEKARVGIRHAQSFLATLGHPAPADGLRRGREAIMRLPPGHPARAIVEVRDFYTLDEFRDLAVHVQEHAFTLPEIGRCLAQIDLRLLELENPPAVRKLFQEVFPGHDARTDLAAWDRFEHANPATFISMYTFWCAPASP